MSNTYIRRIFACKYAEKCQMHIWQMQIWNISNAYAEVLIHISDERILHICKYAQKLLTNAHIEYAEKCQMHIFDESSCKYTEKCQMHITDNCLHEASNA